VPLGFRIDGYRDAAVSVPYVLNYALIGVALVLTGLLDQCLLARAMRPAEAGTATSVTVPDTRVSLLRAIVSGVCLVVIITYIVIAGWPKEFLFVYWGSLFDAHGGHLDRPDEPPQEGHRVAVASRVPANESS